MSCSFQLLKKKKKKKKSSKLNTQAQPAGEAC